MSGTLNDTTLRGTTNIVGVCNLPPDTVGDTEFDAGDPLSTGNQVHRFVLPYFQADGSAMADATIPLHIVRGTTGTIVAIEIAIITAAVGDSTVTVDLQKSTGAGAFATVLSSVITINSSTVVRTATAGTINTDGLVDGDVLELIIDATVGTGTLPQGLVVTVTIDETPS